MKKRSNELAVSAENIVRLIIELENKLSFDTDHNTPRPKGHFEELSTKIEAYFKSKGYSRVPGTRQPNYNKQEVSILKGQQLKSIWTKLVVENDDSSNNIIRHGEEVYLSKNFCNMLTLAISGKLYKSLFGEVSVSLKTKENPPQQLAQFPMPHPSFPATPTIPIILESGKRIFIKDESKNETGTHKDRLAHEIVRKYQEEVIQSQGRVKNISLITAGATGIALSHYFQKYNPNVRIQVLLDDNIDPNIESALRRNGCHIEKRNLKAKRYDPKDIIDATNERGDCLELTFAQEWDGFKLEDISRIKNNYYDWLSYEIFNQNPDICFVPVGSGELFSNILKRVEKIETSEINRLFIPAKNLRKCSFIGVTTDNQVNCDKLFSEHKNTAFQESIELVDKLNSENHQFGKELDIEDYRIKLNKILNEDSDKSVPNAIITFKDSNKEKELLDKAVDIANKWRIDSEYSGIIGLAAYIDLQVKIRQFEELSSPFKILIINTGKLKIEQLHVTIDDDGITPSS